MKEKLFHFKQFSIDQSHAAMKVGTDSDLLGALAAGGNNILDIGTGTGVLALFMAQRFPHANVTAIDIDEGAIIDAKKNFESSPFRNRLTLYHTSLQDFCTLKLSHEASDQLFDSIVCNPPYFDKSLECPDRSRALARHTSSLPFNILIESAYNLLCDGGMFSVILPPEVLSDFSAESLMAGFWLQDAFHISSLPHKAPKRYVLIYKKGRAEVHDHICCIRNADLSYSSWHNDLLKDFLITC